MVAASTTELPKPGDDGPERPIHGQRAAGKRAVVQERGFAA